MMLKTFSSDSWLFYVYSVKYLLSLFNLFKIVLFSFVLFIRIIYMLAIILCKIYALYLICGLPFQSLHFVFHF